MNILVFVFVFVCAVDASMHLTSDTWGVVGVVWGSDGRGMIVMGVTIQSSLFFLFQIRHVLLILASN